APELPLLPRATDIRSRAEGRPSACGGDEQRPAIVAEGATLPPRHIVLGAVALRGWQARVHYAAALWTVTHRRVAPPVVHVLAGGARGDPITRRYQSWGEVREVLSMAGDHPPPRGPPLFSSPPYPCARL